MSLTISSIFLTAENENPNQNGSDWRANLSNALLLMKKDMYANLIKFITVSEMQFRST